MSWGAGYEGNLAGYLAADLAPAGWPDFMVRPGTTCALGGGAVQSTLGAVDRDSVQRLARRSVGASNHAAASAAKAINAAVTIGSCLPYGYVWYATSPCCARSSPASSASPATLIRTTRLTTSRIPAVIAAE
jgi:hypothetical protein